MYFDIFQDLMVLIVKPVLTNVPLVLVNMANVSTESTITHVIVQKQVCITQHVQAIYRIFFLCFFKKTGTYILVKRRLHSILIINWEVYTHTQHKTCNNHKSVITGYLYPQD